MYIRRGIKNKNTVRQKKKIHTYVLESILDTSIPGTAGRPGGVEGYPRAWYNRSIS